MRIELIFACGGAHGGEVLADYVNLIIPQRARKLMRAQQMPIKMKLKTAASRISAEKRARRLRRCGYQS